MPEARSLRSAVTGKGPGEVRVVCQGDDASKSLSKLRDSLRTAQRKGFVLRPSQPRIKLSDGQAERQLEINLALAEECAYNSIQEAVNDSGNNDRVVIMPGRYREPASRRCAGQRPEVRRPDPGGRRRRAHPELPLPGHLPERPEPGLRPGARRARRAGAEPAARQPRGDPRRGQMRALQLPDRGLGREPRRRDHRRCQRVPGQGRRGARRGRCASTWSCGSTGPTASSPATCSPAAPSSTGSTSRRSTATGSSG